VKVRVVLTVEVDPQVWADEYGLDLGEVRDDVRQWTWTRVAPDGPSGNGIRGVKLG